MRLTDLQDNFNKKFAHLATVSDWRHWVALGTAKAASVARDLREAIDDPRVHRVLGHIDALVQPNVSSLGIRLSKITDHSVEVILPDWWRTRNPDGVDEGALLSTAMLAVKTLVGQTAMFASLPVNYGQIQMEKHRPLGGRLRARSEWTHLQQESAWANLRNDGTEATQFRVGFFSDDEMKVAEIVVDVSFVLKASISHAPESGEDL